jgi:hypothetical protein
MQGVGRVENYEESYIRACPGVAEVNHRCYFTGPRMGAKVWQHEHRVYAYRENLIKHADKYLCVFIRCNKTGVMMFDGRSVMIYSAEACSNH